MHSEHFSEQEVMCQCGCGRADMDPGFMDRLEELREHFGKPLTLTSAFRCPAHNSEVSTTGADGPHTTGRAVDILIQGLDAFRLVKVALALGFTGLGVKQKSTGRFLHLDDLQQPYPRPRIWSY